MHKILLSLTMLLAAVWLPADSDVYKTYTITPDCAVVKAGTPVDVTIKAECAGNYKFAGWSATLGRKESPADFFEKTKLPITRHRTNKAYDYIRIAKYQHLRKAMLKGEVAIKIPTAGMVPGDYAIHIRGRFMDGKKSSYQIRTFHLTIQADKQPAAAKKITLPAPAPGKALVIPRLDCAGTPGSVLNADIPWYDDFRMAGAPDKKPENLNKVKIFHDNRYIYVGMEAFEKDMDKQILRSSPGNIWCNDTIEINFDPEGKKLLLGKVFIDPNGNKVEMFGADDNTGNERFVFGPGRSFGSELISVKRLKDRWTVEARLPIGAFYNGTLKNKLDVLFNIARTRLSTGKESSDLVPLSRMNHNTPSCYGKLELVDFDGTHFRWQLENLAARNIKKAGRMQTLVSARAINRTGVFRNIKVTAKLLDKKGNLITQQSQYFTALPGKLADIKLELTPKDMGRHYVVMDIYDPEGCLLASQSMELTLSWTPITIQVTRPYYRNNIYATMPEVKTIKANINLSEKLDKPLKVTLTGPNYRQTKTIANPQTVNPVEFPFTGTAVGNYTLEANGVKTLIKKLPASPGEFWVDENNVPHIDGKPYLPFGAPGLDLDWNVRGVNTTITYAHFASTEKLVAWLDTVHKAGKKAIFCPYLAPDPKNKPFSDAARMAGKVSEKQKTLFKELIAVTIKHPAVLGYRIGEEPEGYGHNEDWYIDARKILAELDPYHPTVITNYGIAGQRRYAVGCDVLMPDTYPNYYEDGTSQLGSRSTYDHACNADSLRPFWQMIQIFDWGKPSIKNSPGRAPSYDELREQAFSSFLGNSKGILFYTYNTYGMWFDRLRIGREYLAIEIAGLKDLLLCKTQNVITANRPNVIAGLKRNAKAMAIIAVNLSGQPQTVTFTSKTALPKSLYVNGEKRTVKTRNNRFTDRIGAHTAVIYAAGEFEKDAVIIDDVRQKIKAANRARFKPGNLMAAGEFSYHQMKEYSNGNIPAGVPRLSCSSQIENHRKGVATVYFLQDGIAPTLSNGIMTWTPKYDDPAPWVEVDFGKTVTVGRSVFYNGGEDFGYLMAGKLLAADEKGNFREIAKFQNQHTEVLEIKHTPVKTRKLRLQIDQWSKRRLLHEWEVYSK